MKTKELSSDWHAAIQRTYGDVLAEASRPDRIGKMVIGGKGIGEELNVGPSISPDGQWIAFLSTRSLFSTDLYLAEAATGKIVRKLIPGLPGREVEKRIREGERLSGAGERELAFYLCELKVRRIYKARGHTTLAAYLRARDFPVRRGTDLARIGKKLLRLPILDETFARGEITWSKVRAAAGAASPETDAGWAEYCKSHSLEEVERRAAQLKPHEDPRGRGGFDRKPIKFPYHLLVSAEVHQAFRHDPPVGLGREDGLRQPGADVLLPLCPGRLQLIEAKPGDGRHQVGPGRPHLVAGHALVTHEGVLDDVFGGYRRPGNSDERERNE